MSNNCKKIIEEGMKIKVFGIREYYKNKIINPDLLSNLNGACELAIRLDVINSILKTIDSKISYILDNRTNTAHNNGEIKALQELKEEIENGIKKR